MEWFVENIVEVKGPNVTHASYSRMVPNQHRIVNGDGVPTFHFLIWSFLKWTSRPELYDRVDAFDMHQQAFYLLSDDTTVTTNNSNITNNNHTSAKRNLFADFVCQMLPTATNTCRYLDEQTSDGDFIKRVNVNDQSEHIVSGKWPNSKEHSYEIPRRIHSCPPGSL